MDNRATLAEPATLNTGDELIDVSTLGLDVSEAQRLLASLSDDQMLAIHVLEDKIDAAASVDEKKDLLSGVPGLTDDQIEALLALEETLVKQIVQDE